MTGALAPTPAHCVACSAPRTGPFCAACGQRARTDRITVGGVVRQVVDEVVSVDRGLLHTALAVLRAPGQTARAYVEGRTVRYVGPVKYFVLLVGAAQLLTLHSGILTAMVEGFTSGYDASGNATHGSAGQVRPAVDALSRYFVSFVALAVPLFAGWTRLLFRRAGLTYAEHVVLALYTSAQQLLCMVPLLTPIEATGVKALALLYVTAAVGYQVGALRAFTGVGWAAALWRTLLALLLTLLGWGVLLGVGLTLAVRR